MSAKLQINTRVRRLIYYIEDIEKGLIQIPAFQRDFIWDKKDKLDLFDSLKRGYPIGSILFWKPEQEKFGSNEKIGPYTIPEKKENYFYILDGFQRLSTLFGCLTNPAKTKLKVDEKELVNDFTIYYDLETEEFIVLRPNSKSEEHQVPLYVFLDTFEFLSYSQKLIDKPNFNVLMDRAKSIATTLVDFSLPSIDIIGGEITEAVDIFSRINSKGTSISSDWMISALTYNKDEDFRLGTIIDNLIEELKIFNFQDMKREMVFQCISNSFGKAYFDQSGKIEQLAKKKDFITKTKNVVESIKKSVKFLFEELLILDIKLLPYKNQFIFITDFFNSVINPTDEQIKELKKWFWITTYSNYFTIYSLSKQREAYNKFQLFLRGEIKEPLYNDKPEIPFSVIDFPSKIFFGSVRAKALVLFLLNYSNQFKNLNSDEIEGLNLSYLFYNIRDNNGNLFPESVVPTINRIKGENFSKFKKEKYLFFFLEKVFYSLEDKKYFLTEEMPELFEKKQYNEILIKRKKLIIEEERKFVKDLGMNYELYYS